MSFIKKYILFFVFTVFFFSIVSSFVLAARNLEVIYPDIPNIIKPTTVKTVLTDYVKYIFSFAIVIAGLIAFGSVVYGGFRYITSSVSPSGLSEAKSQIIAGVLGLIVLLASYIILNTINPQLIILNAPTSIKWGIVAFSDANCSATPNEITQDTPLLTGFNSMKFKKEVVSGAVKVDVYPNINYGGSPQPFFSDGTENCKQVQIGSIRMTWQLPGVYFVNNNGVEKFLPSSTATLGDFNDNVRGVKFNNNTGINYGAILHEHQNWQGECEVFDRDAPDVGSGTNPITGRNNFMDSRTSSVTTFTQSTNYVGEGVTFCTGDNFSGTCSRPFRPTDGSTFGWNPWVEDSGIPNDSVTSIKIQGNYLAVLFDGGKDAAGRGTCEVFDQSDANLRNNPIGRCNCGPFGWGCQDCLSSFMIISTK